MTKPQQPLTPPPELVREWYGEYFGCEVSGEVSASESHLVTRAAQWSAEAELDACCEWLTLTQGQWELAADLRAARRPKPPSLAEEARTHLDQLINAIGSEGALAMAEPIRHAIERLEQLENHP